MARRSWPKTRTPAPRSSGAGSRSPRGRGSASRRDDRPVRPGRSPAPSLRAVHLHDSRDARRPGDPGRAGRRPGAQARAGRDRRGHRHCERSEATCPCHCERSGSRCERRGKNPPSSFLQHLPPPPRAHPPRAPCAGRPLGGLAEQLIEWLEGRGGEAPLYTAARHFRKPLWEVADRLARVGAAELHVEPAEAEPATLVERRLELAGEPLTLIERDAKFKRRVRQRALYETLEQLGGSAPVKHLKETLGMSDGVLRALAGSGLARVTRAERMRDPFEGQPGTPPPERLTAEQDGALERIDGLAPGSGAFLFGVTGSGKTLVYLRAVQHAVEAGRGAIVLVAEMR